MDDGSHQINDLAFTSSSISSERLSMQAQQRSQKVNPIVRMFQLATVQ